MFHTPCNLFWYSSSFWTWTFIVIKFILFFRTLCLKLNSYVLNSLRDVSPTSSSRSPSRLLSALHQRPTRAPRSVQPSQTGTALRPTWKNSGSNTFVTWYNYRKKKFFKSFHINIQTYDLVSFAIKILIHVLSSRKKIPQFHRFDKLLFTKIFF